EIMDNDSTLLGKKGLLVRGRWGKYLSMHCGPAAWATCAPEQMDVDEGMQGIALARGSGSEQDLLRDLTSRSDGFPTIKFYNGASEDEFLDDRTASKLVDRFRGLPRQSGGQPLDGGGGAQDRGGRCPWRLPSGCAGRGPRGVGSTPGSGELGGEAPRLGRRRWIPPLGGTRAPQLQGHPGVLPVSPRASGSLARGPRGGPSDNGRRRRRSRWTMERR
ncbi:unnamed protein product, partial [Prorocentrum cordatum]